MSTIIAGFLFFTAMRLKQLKLAGFKSFADSTRVELPGQLIAVVGPNGCGKSNLIDAVRWVLGESSAKNLRGESMTDVVFKGSSERKAVGQAFVELIFENNLGRLSGAFASYAEISLKRMVNREGESAYYLNGTRCRRRDITDLFLGTGANARGYSIIGQGTVSRLIEAKPEDLRLYLEEAAGVSKYKERRRETLQRIHHTRENLARIADVREELARQLQRLEKQAKAAERYTLLKKSEDLCRAQILALKWQKLISEQKLKKQSLACLSLQYETQQTEVTAAIRKRTLTNEQLHEANERYQQHQTRFYQLATEIARLEENLLQRQREKKGIEEDSQQIRQEMDKAEEQLAREQEQQQAACELAELLEHKREQLYRCFLEQEQHVRDKNQQRMQWQKDRQQLQTQLNEWQGKQQSAELKMEHQLRQQQHDLVRLEKLQAERSSLMSTDLKTEWQLGEQEKEELHAQQVHEISRRQDIEQEEQQLKEQLRHSEQQINKAHDDYRNGNTEYAALLASQKAAVARSPVSSPWGARPLLVDLLKVESEWQWACELVLQDMLQAVNLDSLEDIFADAEGLAAFSGSAISFRARAPVRENRACLADKIKGPLLPALMIRLESVFIAETVAEAMALVADLKEEESVICKEGHWLGKGWLRVPSIKEEDSTGLLARQQKMTQLEALLPQYQQGLEKWRQQRDQITAALAEKSKEKAQHQHRLVETNEQLQALDRRLNALQGRWEQQDLRLQMIQREAEDLRQNLENSAEEQLLLQQEIDEAACHVKRLEEQRIGLERQFNIEEAEGGQQKLEEIRLQLHQTEREADRVKTGIQQFQQNEKREQERIKHLQKRWQKLQQRQLELNSPQDALKEELKARLEQHQAMDKAVQVCREEGESLNASLNELEQLIKKNEKAVAETRENIEGLRMEEQALAVKASGLSDLLRESGRKPEEVLAALTAGIEAEDKEEELLGIIERIKRLGAINLAAIEEYARESERKSLLDTQYEDLTEALNSLEQAIAKMDKDICQRLESTFAEVNRAFKSLFPRLFGGGKAQLELTCDNLLEAGIVVMAQPPGKRNSSIHLLSGGEKAMTAVALVFAFFQLNPSPFCMLDEVDAPLDDVNIARFCDLVKEMSECVQFLFITHNKITMELADHLIGVTMREPGVSRLVAVDVQQALTME